MLLPWPNNSPHHDMQLLIQKRPENYKKNGDISKKCVRRLQRPQQKCIMVSFCNLVLLIILNVF